MNEIGIIQELFTCGSEDLILKLQGIFSSKCATRAYKAFVENEVQTAKSLMDKANLCEATAYRILNKLLDLGLISKNGRRIKARGAWTDAFSIYKIQTPLLKET